MIDVKITRKWIKDLRANGMSNAEILENSFKRISILEEEAPNGLADAIREDLRLAGLINDD